MKKPLKYTLTVLAICISIIVGISSINVNMIQYQDQKQNQIQENNNTQLTIVDTSKKYEDIVWEYVCFDNVNKYERAEEFLNTLSFFQQRECKIMGDRFYVFIYYPIPKSEVTVKTNYQSQTQSQTNDIKFKLWDRVWKK